MKIFIFERIGHLTTSYHPEGGLAVVAKNEAHVIELISAINAESLPWSGNPEVEITTEEWQKVVSYDLRGKPEAKVFVFPDAGCC